MNETDFQIEFDFIEHKMCFVKIAWRKSNYKNDLKTFRNYFLMML